MAYGSSIEWTDATWNPVIGCRKVSAGCNHCYAERMAKRLAASCSLRTTGQHTGQTVHDGLRLLAGDAPLLFGPEQILANLDKAPQIGLELSLRERFVPPATDLIERLILKPLHE